MDGGYRREAGRRTDRLIWSARVILSGSSHINPADVTFSTGSSDPSMFHPPTFPIFSRQAIC